MGGIFISYRRKDTAAHAGWLFATLRAHFGEEQLFRDIDSIDLGERFPQVVKEAIATCDVVIALIGEKWLTVTDEHGRPRLESPSDHVHRELVAALEREDLLLIPLLLDGAVIPDAEDLPAPLRPLTERNGLSVDSANWDRDIGRLIEAVERRLGGRRTPLEPPVGIPPAPSPGLRRRRQRRIRRRPRGLGGRRRGWRGPRSARSPWPPWSGRSSGPAAVRRLRSRPHRRRPPPASPRRRPLSPPRGLCPRLPPPGDPSRPRRPPRGPRRPRRRCPRRPAGRRRPRPRGC